MVLLYGSALWFCSTVLLYGSALRFYSRVLLYGASLRCFSTVLLYGAALRRAPSRFLGLIFVLPSKYGEKSSKPPQGKNRELLFG
jgi:hypothetical protein